MVPLFMCMHKTLIFQTGYMYLQKTVLEAHILQFGGVLLVSFLKTSDLLEAMNTTHHQIIFSL